MSNNNFRLYIYYPVVLALVLSGGILLGYMIQFEQPNDGLVLNINQGNENGRKIGNLLE